MNMKRLFFFLGLLPFMTVMAQRKAANQTMASKVEVVPLKAENWDFNPGVAEFADGPDGPVMKVVARGYVVLKNTDIGDGTIEFDDQPTDEQFASFYFHWQDSLENEVFYFRPAVGAGKPYAINGVQYAPTIKGVNCWNLMYHYQTGASYERQKVNHVRLVISGRQMRVYVNSQEPCLEVPCLEGNVAHGTLAFNGKHVISHLVLKPGQTDGLSPAEGLDPTRSDTRYLRHWQVTAAQDVAAPVDFSMASMPGKETVWSPIVAERRGLVNLTRLYGGDPASGHPTHRICWLKTTIHADSARLANLRLGFEDEVWMFLNGAWLYTDKNGFGFPIAKVPAGRLSLENTTVVLPLRKGENELLIGVGSNFFGWGIAARLDDLNGVEPQR